MDRDPDAIEAEHHAVSERLIIASDVLDEQLDANADLKGVLQVVNRLRRQQNILLYGGLLLLVIVLVLGTVIVKVESNADVITRTREATKVFCDQTNRNNDQAHTDFLAQFALDPATRPKFEQFADVAWPHRDCEVLNP